VAPDLGRPEDVIAEKVIGMAVGVDDEPDGEGSDCLEVIEDLLRLPVAEARVDEEDAGVAEHGRDVLVVEVVPPDVDSVADLCPTRHFTQGSRSDAYHRHDDVNYPACDGGRRDKASRPTLVAARPGVG